MIERTWRTLGEAAQAMLSHSKLGHEYWEFAFRCAAYIQNRLPHKGRKISPFEMLTGRREKLLHAKKFGCDAYVHVHAGVRRKFEPKSKKGIFVGYSTNSLAYLIYFPETKRVVTSRDVVFDEKINDIATLLAMKRKTMRERVDWKLGRFKRGKH